MDPQRSFNSAGCASRATSGPSMSASSFPSEVLTWVGWSTWRGRWCGVLVHFEGQLGCCVVHLEGHVVFRLVKQLVWSGCPPCGEM